MLSILSGYQLLQKLPFGGNYIFSKAVCFRAPYFGTINPRIQSVEPGKVVLTFKKRRAVHNHIKTVHVIAICTGLEMGMGVVAEVTIPKHLRWLPKGMSLTYPAKAHTDIRVEALVNVDDFQPNSDVRVDVKAYRDDGTVVVEGEIIIWVTEKPKK